ncbi:MAG: LacI family DNA-binding transcriptional regulator [Capsulimonadales bacterium]|nr:LacI family DNA-binding transcriptional regulator [Capsulimonadales bacterium]
MAVSITDVARRAGVSPGTVSHVLNGNTRAGIAPATQERVRRAAAELGYQPNRMARMLGRGRTDTLGLFISGLTNPFFVRILECAERLALEAGYHVLMETAPHYLGSPLHKAKLRGWPMDGALMWAQPDQTLAHYLGSQADGMPVVYLGGQPRSDGANAVYFDVYGGAQAAMRLLIERGYRRIAYLFPYDWVLRQPEEPRHCAYREACEAVGLVPHLILMDRHEQTRRAGLEAGLSLARLADGERPEALLCFNDVIAEGVLFGLRRAGLRCPEDVALVGFDGNDDARYLDTPLTTVSMPTERLCQEALDLLLRRLREGADAPSAQILVPSELIIGESA